MLFERTAFSKKPEELIRHEIDVLRENVKNVIIIRQLKRSKL